VTEVAHRDKGICVVEHAGAGRAAKLLPSEEVVATFLFDVDPGASELHLSFQGYLRGPSSKRLFSSDLVKPPTYGDLVSIPRASSGDPSAESLASAC
jgi:hypothetical protein